MDDNEIRMHLAAGRYYGRDSACGSKIRHDSEEKAAGHARRLNERTTFSPESSNRAYEAYPCYWCSERFPDSDDLDFVQIYWHVGREMDSAERARFSSPDAMKFLEMEVIHIDVAEPVYGVQKGIQGLQVHNRKYCEGEACSIHHPSDHHMQVFPLNWRSDRGIMERICPHGIGHPDPDDSDYRKRRDGEDNYDTGIHGCDGCCSRKPEL